MLPVMKKLRYSLPRDRGSNQEAVRALLDARADVNTWIADVSSVHYGLTPLTLAMNTNQQGIITLLQNAGAVS